MILAAALILMIGIAAGPIASSASYSGETGLAGLTLSLDQYAERDEAETEDILAQMGLTDTTEEQRSVNGQTLAGLSKDALEQQTDPEEEETIPEDSTEPVETTTQEPVTEPEPVSEYANIGISITDNYVNIRKKPNTDSEILGKLYRGAAATIVDTKGDWVKIESGKVKGYIKSEYLAIGFDAEKLIDQFGTRIATVNTTTLKVRSKKSTESTVLTLIPLGEEYEVIKISEKGDWVKIKVDDTTDGWVSADYVDLRVEFEHAISIEEEQEKLRREQEAQEALRKQQEAERKRQEEAQRKKEEEERKKKEAAQQKKSSSKKAASTSASTKSSQSESSGSSGGDENPSYDADTGSAIASFAKKFVGNPYVYGGTSLTNGTDCSGFTQSIYSNFGISLPRSSYSQVNSGSKVSLNNLQPGDLVFYASNGHINHVAIYIGNGQVCHASSPRSGIKISNMYYRTPYTARRVVN